MRMKTRGVRCAYCGRPVDHAEKEDVLPKCLYPSSKSRSKVQRLKVPSCRDCNESWQDDEPHFRNALVLAGETPNATRRELWNGPILRSFNKLDGLRRRRDITEKLKTVKIAKSERHMIFPGDDEKVMRVIRKIIRGLCGYHKLMSPVLDKQVWVDILKYVVAQELLDQLTSHHREQDIVEYRYQTMNEQGISSAWYITFFERVTFVGLVSISEAGFADQESGI